ncbi:MAG: flavodoxin family protein [Desulfarculales bacterium]|jgi:multimeric flavodoxin WrbA|nr:flavodoxin family protein [Desulfarculales bacterium]
MKLMAFNGSPRYSRNTARLLESMTRGAGDKGAATELINLYQISYQGCISCFRCKKVGGTGYGRCSLRDGLTPVLHKALQAQVLILGTPIYFGKESSGMRAFMERLWFPYYTYNLSKPTLSPAKRRTALLYTMNQPQPNMELHGYDLLVEKAKTYMERFFQCPCQVFIAADTKQMDDYSQYEVNSFDPAAKDLRHRDLFPLELERAYEFGRGLL